MSGISSNPALHCLGFVVFHFLWQGCIVAGALWLANRLLRRASSRSRYACAWLGLLLCLALPLVTWSRFMSGLNAESGTVQTLASSNISSVSPGLSLLVRDSLMPVVRLKLTEAQSSASLIVFPALAGTWFVASALMLWRFRRGWSLTVGRMHAAVPAETETLSMLESASRELGLRRTPLCKRSALIRSPIVAGVLNPVIVVPQGFEKNFPAEERRMLLAHELAHIARGDPWRNLVQCVLESLLFWHPAVIWISRCIRDEREACADEIATVACGEPIVLAHALTHLAEASAGEDCFSLGANRGSLLRRIRLLLSHAFPPRLDMPRFVFALITMPLTLIAAFEAHVNAAVRPPTSNEVSQANSSPSSL